MNVRREFIPASYATRFALDTILVSGMTEPRRDFLKATAAFTALSHSRILGANDRVRAAGIGLGGRCRYLLDVAQQEANCQIVAVSDVYSPRIDDTTAKNAPGATGYADYRQLLERKDIDAVFIGSPDHWHTPMAIDAMRAGKDVYLEKPVTKTIEEGPLLEKAVAETGRVFQAGYQQRSWEHFQVAADLIAAGKLGKVSLVLASWYQDFLRFDSKTNPYDPSKLDASRWLGNAPAQEVTPWKFIRWRWFWDFGGGHLTDLYSHYGDVIHWAMLSDTPRSAVASGGNNIFPEVTCPDTLSASYSYPSFEVTYSGAMHCKLEAGHLVFRGDKAMMKLNREGFAVYPENVLGAERNLLPEPVFAMRSQKDGTRPHVVNFIECVRSRKTPNASVKTSVASARAAHLGNLAFRTGEKVVWKG
jgi:predicted dehydrogenase